MIISEAEAVAHQRIRIIKPVERTQPPLLPIILFLLVSAAFAAYIFFRLPAKNQTPVSPDFEVIHLSGSPEIYRPEKKHWERLQVGNLFSPGSKIRTDPLSRVDLKIPDQIHIRLKPNSEIQARRSALKGGGTALHLHLLRGTLLGAVHQNFPRQGALLISTPHLYAILHSAMFLLNTDAAAQESWMALLRGTAELRSPQNEPIVLHGLEKIRSGKEHFYPAPSRLSRSEWNHLKEAYDLKEKKQIVLAKDMDLSKKAGSLFETVFDHGTFYNPKAGFARREFIPDPEIPNALLEIVYDVSPSDSTAGMYLKTRDLDLSRFQALEVEVRKKKDEALPQSFRLEIKSQSEVVYGFSPRLLRLESWQKFHWDLRLKKRLMIDEITLVVTNSKAGESKKGALLFKNLNLIPKDSAALPPPEETREKLSLSPQKRRESQAPPDRPQTSGILGHAAKDDLDILMDKLKNLDHIVRENFQRESKPS